MAGSIIPPSMAGKNGNEVFLSYMEPIRNKDNSWSISVTVHTCPPNIQMIAQCELRVLKRDSGIALADAIKMVVMKEVPPPIARPDERN